MAILIFGVAFLLGGCMGQRGQQGNPQNYFQPQEYSQEKRNQDPLPPPTQEPQAPAFQHGTPIPIISFDKQQSIDGSYKTSYETGNHIVAEETGFLKNVGVKDEEALVQHGSYSYTDPDGNVITVTYTADEGGFRPQGDHLPTPPPIPEGVQKGLDIIFEQIRLQAEKGKRENQFENTQQESANFPNEPPTPARRYRR